MTGHKDYFDYKIFFVFHAGQEIRGVTFCYLVFQLFLYNATFQIAMDEMSVELHLPEIL